MTTEEETERRVITPLRRMLSQMSLDDLLEFLHEMNVGWYLRRHGNKYVCRIHGDGMPTYMNTSNGVGPKMALVNTLVSFLVAEKRDFHDVANLNSPFRKQETQ